MQMKKSEQLRRLIAGPELAFLCEAHNGISAKIVEEAGFSGIWASGLTIAAALGVRDNNEASWTQVLDVAEFMSDATGIPILLDGDTGYGNFNNMRRLVRKLEQRDVAGVCIEDKLFPKRNSLSEAAPQPIAEIDEFCGKIKAGRDAQRDAAFCIVARTEAFIAGWGVKEALRRAEAYRLAGADAIIVHSKKNTPADIELFMKEWGRRHPIIVIPTKYYSTPTERFRQLGISVVIWANQLMRASVKYMQDIAREIHDAQSIAATEDRIAPLTELFRLQGDLELREAEQRFLPARGKTCSAIILAASRGEELSALTETKPKAMLEFHKTPVLHHTIEMFNSLGIMNVAVVRGYRKETIAGANFVTIDNDEHATTRDLYSLYLARERLQGDCLVAYGDCLYKKHLIADLVEHGGDLAVVVDATVRKRSKPMDLVRCSKEYANDFINEGIVLTQVLSGAPGERASGEWTGLLSVSARSAGLVRSTLESMARRPDFKRLSITDLLAELIPKTAISVVYTRGGWIDIDDMRDYEETGRF